MFKYRLRCELAVMAVAVVCMGGPAAGEVQYTITTLGEMHEVFGVNELGQVVGDQGSITFLWDDGVQIELGPVGWAYDINEASLVVGTRQGGAPGLPVGRRRVRASGNARRLDVGSARRQRRGAGGGLRPEQH